MPDADNSEAMQRLIRELNDANEQIRRLQRDLDGAPGGRLYP